MAENKVTFGLKNAHYAVITDDGSGALTYGTPVKLPGSTELSLDAKGDSNDFYADDTLYYTDTPNQGYDGSITLARLTDAFRTDVLGETLGDTDSVLTEMNSAKPKKIALLFEFDGDQKATRHAMYYVTVSRPGIASQTKQESTEPGTVELPIVASPRPGDGVVKRSTSASTTASVYDAWYNDVYEPPVTVVVSPSEASVPAGGTQQLTATVTGTANKSVVWTSGDETIATVDNNGLVTVDSAATTGETVIISAMSVVDDMGFDSATITVS